MRASPLLDGFYETAYVTRDMDAALGRLRSRDGIANFHVFAPPASRGPVSHIARVAKTFVADRMIEIIEPNPAVASIFEGYTPAIRGDLRFHHIGYIVADDAHWDAIIGNAARAGIATAYQGFVEGYVRSLFLDTREQLGHFSEYLQNFEGGTALLEMIPRN